MSPCYPGQPGLFGWARRAATLLWERFSPIPHAALSLLIGAAAARLYVDPPPPGDAYLPAAATAAASVFALLLLFRLSDDLKDRAHDRLLFPERPLPSGRVSASDVRWLMALAIGFVVLLNLHSLPKLLAAASAVGYIALLHRYLFIPRFLLARPVLNLAVHNPVFAAIAITALAAAAFSQDALERLDPTSAGLFVAAVWMPFLGWELARKLSGAEVRPAYDVYSPVLGRTATLILAAGVQSLALALVLLLAERLSLGTPARLVAIAAWMLTLVSCSLCSIRAGPRTGQLLERSAQGVLAAVPGALVADMAAVWAR